MGRVLRDEDLIDRSRVVGYTDHLDECHQISDRLTNALRSRFAEMRAEAARWKPLPIPDDWR